MAYKPSQTLNRRERHWGSKQDAADYLGVSKRTIDEMISDGRITAYRNGNKLVRIDMDELDARMTPSAGSADRLAQHIADLLSQAPPLTDEQRERISALLRAGTVGDDLPTVPSGSSAPTPHARKAAVRERIAELESGGA